MRLDEANETLKRLSVISPSPGIAILTRNWSTGNKYQIGDQCWSGSYLIKLPDLSSLKATVRINEVDISKIEKGLKVEIKPDAFSDSTFTGSVYSVANLAVNKEGSKKIKVFPVEILINETNENLLPGMTVSCRIIMDEIPDVTYIPLEALHKEGDKNYVYKKTMGGFDKVEVETGISNSDYIIITKGLSEKDNVALINPFATEKESEEKSIEE
ncbi:MAG: HlyD family efflux transporter periplasmic adaptor subunit [Odoribacter sp.]|nr:HlyD family efflux transporter periplasmic adaptor subunit [Odoribacter sp.]